MTYNMQQNPDGTIKLIPAEGQIIEPGTPIIAQNMNKLEDAMELAFTFIDNHISPAEVDSLIVDRLFINESVIKEV